MPYLNSVTGLTLEIELYNWIDFVIGCQKIVQASKSEWGKKKDLMMMKALKPNPSSKNCINHLLRSCENSPKQNFIE